MKVDLEGLHRLSSCLPDVTARDLNALGQGYSRYEGFKAWRLNLDCADFGSDHQRSYHWLDLGDACVLQLSMRGANGKDSSLRLDDSLVVDADLREVLLYRLIMRGARFISNVRFDDATIHYVDIWNTELKEDLEFPHTAIDSIRLWPKPSRRRRSSTVGQPLRGTGAVDISRSQIGRLEYADGGPRAHENTSPISDLRIDRSTRAPRGGNIAENYSRAWEPELAESLGDADDLIWLTIEEWVGYSDQPVRDGARHRAGGIVAMHASRWPWIDEIGRIRFPDSVDSPEFTASADEFAAFLRRQQLLTETETLRLGNVYASKLRLRSTAQANEPLTMDELDEMLGRIIDISQQAQAAASAAAGAALSIATLDERPLLEEPASDVYLEEITDEDGEDTIR